MSVDMILKLLAGVGLFLYGMKIMSDGLEKAAGARLRNLLNMLTKNRLVGVLVGILFTMVVQSSSATTVMVVSFVNAGLLTLAQSVGVILGANIGTTVTALLVAIKLTTIAPLLLAAGVVMVMFIKKGAVQRIGMVVLGFGMLFFGMAVMSEAIDPLKDDPQIANMLISFANPILALLIGIAVTCLFHSSSATVGLLQVMALQLNVPLEISMYIILGCNIGTCVDALLAGLAGNKNAKRAALIHLFFNVIGSTIILLLLQFIPAASWIHRFSSSFSGHNPAMEIFIAHASFKVVEVLLFLPFTNLLVRLVTFLVPGSDQEASEMHLQYLSESIMQSPPAAVHQAVQETARMGKLAMENLHISMDALLLQDAEKVREVESNEKVINYLNHSITHYLIRINQLDLSTSDINLIGSLFHVVNDIERIGDHAENMSEFASQRIEQSIAFTERGEEGIRTMLTPVEELIHRSIELITNPDESKLPGIRKLEDSIDVLEKKLQYEHVDRIAAGLCTPQASMIYADVLSNLERVADHAQNIAFLVAERTPPMPITGMEPID